MVKESDTKESDETLDSDDLFERKSVEMKEHKRIVGQLSEELKRKDDTIDALKEKNNLLLNTTVRQAEKISELIEKLKKINNR
ncbi:MAG: hypothetical protein ACLFUO_02970 [Candidatus Woesearchaeota archaeon]